MKKKFLLIGIFILSFSCGIYLLQSQFSKNDSKNKNHLKILTWEGYADLRFVKQFEKEQNVNVEVSYIKNDDELWKLVNNNEIYGYDVIAANTAEIKRYISSGFLEEINESEISNLSLQENFFKNKKIIEEIFLGEKRFAVPYAFAEMGLIYNKSIIKNPPTSMLDLLNKKYKGQVLAYDTYQHNFSFMALSLGIKDPFNLSDSDYNLVTKKLYELKNNVLSFYTTLEEATNLYRDYEIALVYANFGKQQLNDLKKLGANVGYIIPKESALAWLDCWAILKNSKHKALAHQWINFTLTKEVSENLKIQHELSHTLSTGSVDYNLTWLRPVSDPDKRMKTWEMILKQNKVN